MYLRAMPVSTGIVEYICMYVCMQAMTGQSVAPLQSPSIILNLLLRGNGVVGGADWVRAEPGGNWRMDDGPCHRRSSRHSRAPGLAGGGWKGR